MTLALYRAQQQFGIIEIGKIAVHIIILLVGLYFLGGVYQLLFIELRRKFIVHHLKFEAGVFSLRGYYFKHASFKETEVEKVEPYVLNDKSFF